MSAEEPLPSSPNGAITIGYNNRPVADSAFGGSSSEAVNFNLPPSQCVTCYCAANKCVCLKKKSTRSGYGTVRNPNREEQSLRCHCHVVEAPSKTDKTARNKLLIACGIALVFTIGEAVGEPHSLTCSSLSLTLSLSYRRVFC